MRTLAALAVVVLSLCLFSGAAWADKGIIEGTVLDARSGGAVGVHPVALSQGATPLGRVLTDRQGRFHFDFTYTPGQPLTLSTSSTTGYVGAEGPVEANTDITIKIMPRWATVMGFVTDRQTGRGMGEVPVRAGRGAQFVADAWGATRTDSSGLFMLKVPVFDGDDLTQPVRDLWLSFNEGEGNNLAFAEVRSAAIPLWAWPDPTQPTRVDVSLPAATATGLTLSDVLTVKAPEALAQPAAAVPAAAAPATAPTDATPAPAPTSGAAEAPPAITLPPVGAAQIVEFEFVCPHCGEKLRMTLTLQH